MALWTAIKMTFVMVLLTGIVYPIVMVVLANALFPFQARGSLVVHDGTLVGSQLIGQSFSSPRYFHGRPSAAGDKGYDASASSGSNLGPTNKTLIASVQQRLKEVLEKNPGTAASQVPIDLLTASGSGLDPEISPAAADLQVPRIAKARGFSDGEVRALVRAHTRYRWADILGEPGVNVLELNLALDNASAPPRVGMKTSP